MLRYNVNAWLEILSRAKPRFHHQHMVMSDIAKWLVPILCRGPGNYSCSHISCSLLLSQNINSGKVLPDFPSEMISTKLKLAQNYLSVLNIIEPGINSFRAKFMFEYIDTKIYFFSKRFQETGEANIKELHGKCQSKQMPQC